MNNFFTLFFLGIIALLNGCSGDDDTTALVTTNPSSTERGVLISYQQTGSLKASEIASNRANIGNVSAFTTNDVTIYRVVYSSLYKGASTQVSGLVMIPQTTITTLQLVQRDHGTIIPIAGSENEISSNYTNGITESIESDRQTGIIPAIGYRIEF